MRIVFTSHKHTLASGTMSVWFAILVFCIPVRISAAQQPVFHLPLDCIPGKTCFIQNYVDTDPTNGFHDYTCGFLTYDNHKGTDFRLPTLKSMYAGVKVFAAAPGVVRAIRDGMPDVSVKKIDGSLIKGREAGNSVAIRHGDGWETQYSHMLQGSVQVKAGDHVETGQVLGMVGLSGNTEFPHLHFSVRHHGRTIDPFTSEPAQSGCNLSAVHSMWDKSTSEALIYRPSGIITGGFSDQFPTAKPAYENIVNKTSISADADKIIFWVLVYGVRDGDFEGMRIVAPDGKIIAQKKIRADRTLAQEFIYTGRRRKESAWTPGEYKGYFLLRHTEENSTKTMIESSFNLEVTVP